MEKINEKALSKFALRNGAARAIGRFKKFYENKVGYEISLKEKRNNIYFNFLESVWSSIDTSYLFETDFVTIHIPEGIDKEIFEEALLLLRKHTYYLGLRTIKSEKENLIYIYFDNVINKGIYYVDEESSKKIIESIRYKEQILR